MVQFPKDKGRNYWSLEETSQWLDIPKDLVLEHLKRDALVHYKGQAIKKTVFDKNNDFDIDDTRWIEGLFWLPIDAYVELDDLLNNEIQSIIFSELLPQCIKIKDRLDCGGTKRSHAATGWWIPIRKLDKYEITLNSVNNLYFWDDTVSDFALENGINLPLADNMMPTDVILKELANDLVTSTTKTKPRVPKLQLEALNKLLKEIEQRAISKQIPFNRNEMFGTRKQLHELAGIRFNTLLSKSPHTFFDYLKNGGICKVKHGNRWSPIYSELFPEHPELKDRETRVKT